MNLYKSSILVAALAMGFGFTSCDDDDELSYSGKPVANTEMREFLKGKGYQFNEAGNLLMDAKVAATDSLDLSGSKLTDLSDLVLFPNLKYVDLSNNGYGPVYDFATLPQNIQGVDLTGNEIYDFEGLVDAKVENDAVKTTILRKLTGLQLPATAKFNVEDLMPFYMQNKAEGNAVNMTMADENGAMEAYTTLREIPDENFRGYLKTKFSSIFADETHIDIAKPMDINGQGQSITIEDDWSYPGTSKMKDFTGIEYFINNPYYKKFGIAVFNYNENYKIKYFAPRANISALLLSEFSTDATIDLSKATSLCNILMDGNQNIESIDLSNTKIGNQDIKEFDAMWSNILALKHCPKLADIKFGEFKFGYIDNLEVVCAPEMKNLDLSKVVGLGNLSLVKLENCTITYPNLKYFVSNGETLEEVGSSSWSLSLAITEDVFNQEATKTFIKTYRKNLTDAYRDYREDGGYRWSKYL